KPSLETPADLQKLLKNNGALLRFFDSLSYTHRKEYIRWIEDAKKAETRQARLKKAVEMLKQKTRHP
ncbi:MAG TPA: antitermination protein NusB, partial [Bacteroidetes bacterium]|nr:antitermination protein NusB [Bacteroidota bacterium]